MYWKVGKASNIGEMEQWKGYYVRENRRATKNGHSRAIGNTGHTRHRMKTNKTHKHNTTQKR
jgi:hypothetical protein